MSIEGYWNQATELPEGAIATNELKVGDKFEIITRDERFRQFVVIELPSAENDQCGKLEIIRGELFNESRDYDDRDKGFYSFFVHDRETALNSYQRFGSYRIRI
jgi:hypothetical protein